MKILWLIFAQYKLIKLLLFLLIIPRRSFAGALFAEAFADNVTLAEDFLPLTPA